MSARWKPGSKVSQQNIALSRWLVLFTSPVDGFNVVADWFEWKLEVKRKSLCKDCGVFWAKTCFYEI